MNPDLTTRHGGDSGIPRAAIPFAVAVGVLACIAVLAFPADAAGPNAGVPVPTITDPASGSTVTTATPRVAGTGQPGDIVIVSDAGLIRCVATVTADAQWACTSTSPLNNGVHHLSATQTDRTGAMSGRSGTLNLRVRAPSKPTTSTAPSQTTETTQQSTSAPTTAPTTAPSTASGSDSGNGRNVPLAIAAVLALAGTLGAGAYLRMRPRR